MALFNLKGNVKPWTYNWGGLTTLLSIFLFLIYLFIRLNVSVYKLMIYKWSKIRAPYAFWLNRNEMQLWKLIGKNRNSICLDCPYHNIRMRMWFVWLISTFWPLVILKGWGVPKLFWIKNPLFTFFKRNFSALKLLNH